MVPGLLLVVLLSAGDSAPDKPRPAPAEAKVDSNPAAKPEPKPAAPSPRPPAEKASRKRPTEDDDEDNGLPPARFPHEVPHLPMSWPEWIATMAMRVLLVWGPLAFLVGWVAYVGTLAFAPEFGYRLRARLPWGHTDRGKMKAEMHDLALQIADRDLPHLRYKLGRLYQLFGKRRQAVEMLAPVVAADPAHVDASYMLGRALIDLGRPAEAVAPLERAAAIKENHDYGGLLLALARARSAAGRHAEAEADVRRALAVSPDLPEGLYVSGTVLASAGKRDEAVAAWRRCGAVLQTSAWSFRRKNKEWLRKSRFRLWFG